MQNPKPLQHPHCTICEAVLQHLHATSRIGLGSAKHVTCAVAEPGLESQQIDWRCVCSGFYALSCKGQAEWEPPHWDPAWHCGFKPFGKPSASISCSYRLVIIASFSLVWLAQCC